MNETKWLCMYLYMRNFTSSMLNRLQKKNLEGMYSMYVLYLSIYLPTVRPSVARYQKSRNVLHVNTSTNETIEQCTKDEMISKKLRL